MKHKGINYDVGDVLEGFLMRPTFDAEFVHRELAIIKNDLHCNAVKICGLDLDRLMTTAEDALKQGLEVWLAPRMFEKSEARNLRLYRGMCYGGRNVAKDLATTGACLRL